MLEARPAKVVVEAALGVLAFGEDSAFQLREFQAGGFVLLQRMQVIEPLQEQQVSDLLDDFERVGDAAGPEGISEGVNLAEDIAVELGDQLRGRAGKAATGKEG